LPRFTQHKNQNLIIYSIKAPNRFVQVITRSVKVFIMYVGKKIQAQVALFLFLLPY